MVTGAVRLTAADLVYKPECQLLAYLLGSASTVAHVPIVHPHSLSSSRENVLPNERKPLPLESCLLSLSIYYWLDRAQSAWI